MSYFQSETMVFCQAILPKQIAWQIMDRLGQMNCVHIVKPLVQKPIYQNPFGMNLKRCQQTLLKIKYIKNFLIQFSSRKLKQCINFKEIFSQFENQLQQRNIHGHLYINEIEEQVVKIQSFLLRQKKQFDNIRQGKTKMIQNAALLLTLSKCINIEAFYKQKNIDISYHTQQQDLDMRRKSSLKLQYKCGLINRVDQILLKRIVFRMSKGNAWVQTFQIPYEDVLEIFKSDQQVKFIKNKLTFIIIFQSGEHYAIEQKINKVLGSIDCYTDPRKPNASNIAELLVDFKRRLQQHNSLQQITRQCIKNYVDHMYECKRGSKFSYLTYLQCYTKKQILIYKALGNCTPSNNFLAFNAFIPTNKLQKLKNLKTKRVDLPSLMISPKPTQISPPTLFTLFQLLEIPQQIVNTYGIPSYKQFNPAVLYIVTFGFFVGVMFGDIGHMLLGIAVMLYFKPNKWWWTVVFWMGYCGLIYNQFFGLNFGWTDSCFNVSHTAKKIIIKQSDCVCLFGLDPVWKIAQNKMQFINSFKMKLAVIIGVVHMTLGIFLRGVNSYKKTNYYDIITVVIPQVIFIFITFVYMDFLIILKWLKEWKKTQLAPSIITNMIQMFVGHSQDYLQVYNNQSTYQKLLVALTFILIPIMLITKPFYIYLNQKYNPQAINSPKISEQLLYPAQKKQDPLAKELQMQKQQPMQLLVKKNQTHEFHQILIHQLIQTIQFVLGTVSNTASYLRLWALSLAHSELAQVFLSLILQSSLMQGYSGSVKLFVYFGFFIVITFCVLFCMDIMECFLHSLRLHWVQFQNKFYQGNGYSFNAYSFEKQLSNNSNN